METSPDRPYRDTDLLISPEAVRPHRVPFARAGFRGAARRELPDLVSQVGPKHRGPARHAVRDRGREAGRVARSSRRQPRPCGSAGLKWRPWANRPGSSTSSSMQLNTRAIASSSHGRTWPARCTSSRRDLAPGGRARGPFAGQADLRRRPPAGPGGARLADRMGLPADRPLMLSLRERDAGPFLVTLERLATAPGSAPASDCLPGELHRHRTTCAGGIQRWRREGGRAWRSPTCGARSRPPCGCRPRSSPGGRRDSGARSVALSGTRCYPESGVATAVTRRGGTAASMVHGRGLPGGSEGASPCSPAGRLGDRRMRRGRRERGLDDGPHDAARLYGPREA